MKNTSSRIIALSICLVLILSIFAACGKKDGDTKNPTLSPDESWYPGIDSTYEPVTISDVQLADIVKEALGDEAKDFNGDLGSLTDKQLKKVEKLAEKKGYEIENDANGKPVIKDPSHAEASDDEVKKILDNAGVTGADKASKEDYEKVSKAAAQSGMEAVTDKNGKIDIIKPVPTQPATQKPGKTKKNEYPSAPAGKGTLTQGYIAPAGTTLVRTNIADCVWKSTYSSKTNDTFVGSAAASDGAVFVGTTFQSAGSESATNTSGLIVKIDTEGKRMWSKTVGGNNLSNFESVAVLNDGSAIAVGTTYATNIAPDEAYKCKGSGEGLVVKFAPDGSREWLRLYGGSESDILYAVAPTPDGGYVIGGKTTSTDGDLRDTTNYPTAAFIIRCDTDGNILWKKALGSTKHCAVTDFAVADNGTIYAAISTYYGDGDFANIQNVKSKGKSTVCAKFDSNGNVAWLRALSDTGATELKSIVLSPDGGCVLAGQYSTDKTGRTERSFKDIYNGGLPGTSDGVIVKLSPDGYTRWILPLIGYENDCVTGIVKVPGGYAVSGYTTSSNRDFQSNSGNFDSFVYVISEYGEKQTFALFGGSSSDTARGICGNGDKNVYVCGITNSSDGYFADCADKGNENCAVAYAFKYNLK